MGMIHKKSRTTGKGPGVQGKKVAKIQVLIFSPWVRGGSLPSNVT